jgi:hypothetical protein
MLSCQDLYFRADNHDITECRTPLVKQRPSDAAIGKFGSIVSVAIHDSSKSLIAVSLKDPLRSNGFRLQQQPLSTNG